MKCISNEVSVYLTKFVYCAKCVPTLRSACPNEVSALMKCVYPNEVCVSLNEVCLVIGHIQLLFLQFTSIICTQQNTQRRGGVR